MNAYQLSVLKDSGLFSILTNRDNLIDLLNRIRTIDQLGDSTKSPNDPSKLPELMTFRDGIKWILTTLQEQDERSSQVSDDLEEDVLNQGKINWVPLKVCDLSAYYILLYGNTDISRNMYKVINTLSFIKGRLCPNYSYFRKGLVPFGNFETFITQCENVYTCDETTLSNNEMAFLARLVKAAREQVTAFSSYNRIDNNIINKQIVALMELISRFNYQTVNMPVSGLGEYTDTLVDIIDMYNDSSIGDFTLLTKSTAKMKILKFAMSRNNVFFKPNDQKGAMSNMSMIKHMRLVRSLVSTVLPSQALQN